MAPKDAQKGGGGDEVKIGPFLIEYGGRETRVWEVSWWPQ